MGPTGANVAGSSQGGAPNLLATRQVTREPRRFWFRAMLANGATSLRMGGLVKL